MLTLRRIARIITAMLLPLMLASCYIAPGKFVSQMLVQRDGSYQFSYSGEISMLVLSDIVREKLGNEDATNNRCYADNGNERICTQEETTERKRARDARRNREAEQMSAMLGGFDPTSPDAINELVAKLRRQRGWTKVEHKGNGVFDVNFAINGQLDHDFQFPTMEGLPPALTSQFVSSYLRQNNAVRLVAPGFSADASSGGMLARMATMGTVRPESEEARLLQSIPELDGTFTIVTDAEILTNNTDEGATTQADGMKRLEWRITPRTANAPEAILQLAQ